MTVEVHRHLRLSIPRSVTTIPPGFVVLPNPVISEFMADNADTIEDEDCRSSDWLEVFNATADSVNLDGWYLTDDPAVLNKWSIPNLSLIANMSSITGLPASIVTTLMVQPATRT